MTDYLNLANRLLGAAKRAKHAMQPVVASTSLAT
jgi:hypothetical protein